MSKIITPDLCDEFPEVQVVEPGFNNYGGVRQFGGEIVTVKCFEDNSVVKEQVGLPGNGRVMVVDGGASKRNALLGDMLAEKAAENGWAGLIIYGCIRDVDEIGQTNLGVQALGTVPRKTEIHLSAFDSPLLCTNTLRAKSQSAPSFFKSVPTTVQSMANL